MVGGTFVWVNGYRFGPGSRVVCLWCHWVHLLRHVLKPTAYWFIYCKSNPSTLLYQVRKGLITSPCNDDETVMSRLALILKYTDLFLSGLSYFNDSNKIKPKPQHIVPEFPAVLPSRFMSEQTRHHAKWHQCGRNKRWYSDCENTEGTNVAFRLRCGNKQHILHPFPVHVGRLANSDIIL